MVRDFVGGWIYPDGTIKIVPVFGHFEALFACSHALTFIDFSTYGELKTWAEEKYADACYEWTRWLEPDEHPAWHAFNCYTSDFIADTVYEAGFIRFGCYTTDMNERELETESESVPNENYIRDAMLQLNADIATCRNRSAKIIKRFK
jgi:hypothetical protein